MSNLEDRLRDAFRADAQTVRPQTIPDVPARPLRRAPKRAWSRLARTLVPLAAAAAVAAIAAGVWLVAPLPGLGHGSSPAAAPPRFFVTVWIADGGAESLVVRDTGTGKIVGRLDPPSHTLFGGVAASADNTFVTFIFSPGYKCPSTSELYQFRLNKQGQPGPLVSLHVKVPGRMVESGAGDLASTPDGRTIAYIAGGCGAGGGEVGVINVATRHVKVWTTGPAIVRGQLQQTEDLSLSADGSLLAYNTMPGAWILNTSAPAGPLQERSRKVSRTASWAALAGDGDSLYVCTVSHLSQARDTASHGTVTYAIDSIATGHQQVIASWPGLPWPECFASLDPSGQHLLVQYPVNVPHATNWVRPAILDLRSGQLTKTPAPAFYGPLDIAW